MKPRLVIVFAVLVLGPLAVIGWLGVRTTLHEQELVRRQFDDFLSARLANIELTITKVIDRKERELKQLAERIPDNTEGIRELMREQAGIAQVFLMDAKGVLVHPPRDAPRSQAEEAFIERTKSVFEAKERFYRAADGNAKTPSRGAGAVQSEQGWYTYYFGTSDHFIFWLRKPGDQIVGFDLNRPAFIAEIIGELPSTDRRDATTQSDRVQLSDAQGDSLYLFGRYDPPDNRGPAVSRELAAPLGAWRLYYFISEDRLNAGFSQSALFGTAATLAALVLAVFVLAFYFFRESGREAREAQQRVTFVNQVSHELKTPLTNIRMYAELLQDEIDDTETKPRDYLKVIVSESERLSRLINNVLSLARYDRKKLAVRPQPEKIDQAIASVIDQFRPSLESYGFEIVTRLHREGRCHFDPDALRQILANLLSNVEKYAKTGRWVEITSTRRGQEVIICVTDRGPGVPASARKEIFEPFFRLSQKIAEGVSGTGIGLSISRELARLHGGDLSLRETPKGARFEVTLNAPLVQGESPDEGIAG